MLRFLNVEKKIKFLLLFFLSQIRKKINLQDHIAKVDFPESHDNPTTVQEPIF